MYEFSLLRPSAVGFYEYRRNAPRPALTYFLSYATEIGFFIFSKEGFKSPVSASARQSALRRRKRRKRILPPFSRRPATEKEFHEPFVSVSLHTTNNTLFVCTLRRKRLPSFKLCDCQYFSYVLTFCFPNFPRPNSLPATFES